MTIKFALIGAAGYVAPKHMNAIKNIGGELVAITDPFDSVGVIDSHFFGCKYFKEVERFDRHLSKLEDINEGVDYISICSPNYLHDAHCRFALRLGANAICEKPLVLKPKNIDQLQEVEYKTGNKIYTVLQLRLHPELIRIRSTIDNTKKRHKVTIKYCTPRGPWYDFSWKGNENLSGGIATNIGIHLFDMVIWLFGDVDSYEVKERNEHKISGNLILSNADVEWFLSIDPNDVPEGYKSYRSITIDGEPLLLDGLFRDLHTEVYHDIISGNGFGIEEARKSIELVHKLRNGE
jgi:UDP-N-acetyl-2-amino-2-deoxyglucuronate dehydrogenase